MSLTTYKCRNCGAAFGIAGENTGSDDDYAADEYFDSEVDYHESGLCKPVVSPALAEHTSRAHQRIIDLADSIDPGTPIFDGLARKQQRRDRWRLRWETWHTVIRLLAVAALFCLVVVVAYILAAGA